jgi:glutamine amidotransferase
VITILDYGLGNVGAFANVYKRMNIPARMARTASDLDGAERIVLPGVGAFDHAMNLLDASGMRDALEQKVVEERVPVLGVCVGMQMLAEGSDEGERPGLGWIPGRVRHFSHVGANQSLPMPHMGWNDVTPALDQRLFAGLEEAARFYFLHSYYFECDEQSDAAAHSLYGAEFACAVRREHVYGVQFHPEKSHHFGAALLSNFAKV